MMITNWSECPIGVMQEVNEINDLHVSDEEKTFMATALLAGMDYDEFMSLPLDKARELVANASFVSKQPNKVKLKKEYQIGDTVYVLHRDIMDITTAQYIDFQAIVHDIEHHLPELMAIVLIPKGKRYNEGYSNSEVIDEIRENLSVEEALSIADFFTTKSDKLIKQMLTKSEAAITAALILAKKKDKEFLKALQTQMHLTIKELRSGFGYHWWKQWPA